MVVRIAHCLRKKHIIFFSLPCAALPYRNTSLDYAVGNPGAAAWPGSNASFFALPRVEEVGAFFSSPFLRSSARVRLYIGHVFRLRPFPGAAHWFLAEMTQPRSSQIKGIDMYMVR